jgi:hypothetical protein
VGFHEVAGIGRHIQNRKETSQKEKKYTKQYKNTKKKFKQSHYRPGQALRVPGG